MNTLQQPMLLSENEVRKNASCEDNVARNKLVLACIVSGVFMIVEVICGYLANSLAIMTDATHLLSDLCAFLVSFFSIWVSSLPGTPSMSFGYHRAEILGALLSVAMIWVTTVGIVYSALGRIARPPPVNGKLMFVTAVFGTAANIFITYILGMHSHGMVVHDHNHHGAHTGPCGAHKHGEEQGNHDHDHNHSHHHNHHDHSEHTHPSNNKYTKGTPKVFPVTKKENTSVDSHESCITRSAVKYSEAKANSVEEPFMSVEIESVPNKQKSDVNDGTVNHYKHNSHNAAHQTMDATRQIENINLKAAYIHAVGDLIQNIGVLVGAGLIWIKPTWAIADPICSLIFSLFVVFTTYSIIKEATNVLMEGVPIGCNFQQILADLKTIPGVCEVHDFHVWSLSVGKPSLACHIVIEKEYQAREILREATYLAQNKHRILHTTIQMDYSHNKAACETDAHAKCHGLLMGICRAPHSH